jgi:hypothetical protein
MPKHVVVTVKRNGRCTQTATSGTQSQTLCGGRKRKTYFTEGGGCSFLHLFHDARSTSGYVAPNGGTAEDLEGYDSLYGFTALWTLAAFSVS